MIKLTRTITLNSVPTTLKPGDLFQVVEHLASEETHTYWRALEITPDGSIRAEYVGGTMSTEATHRSGR